MFTRTLSILGVGLMLSLVAMPAMPSDLPPEEQQLASTHFRLLNLTRYRLEVRTPLGESEILLPDGIATLKYRRGIEAKIYDADTNELRLPFNPLSAGTLEIVAEDTRGGFQVMPYLPQAEGFVADARKALAYLVSGSPALSMSRKTSAMEASPARTEPTKAYPVPHRERAEKTTIAPPQSDRQILETGTGKRIFYITNFTDRDVEIWYPAQDGVIPVNATMKVKYPVILGYMENYKPVDPNPWYGYFVSPGLKIPLTAKLRFEPENHYVYQLTPDGRRQLVKLESVRYRLPDQPVSIDGQQPVWTEIVAPEWVHRGDRGEYECLNHILWEMYKLIDYDHRQRNLWVRENYGGRKVWFEGEVRQVSRGGMALVAAEGAYAVWLDTRNRIDPMDTQFRKGTKVIGYGTLTGGPREEDVTTWNVTQVTLDSYEVSPN